MKFYNHRWAWLCDVCGRATPTCYRCQNWDCGADLAGRALDSVGVTA